MTPEDFQKVRELFLSAKELAPQEREAFLDRACAGRADLRSEVEALLKQVDSPRDKQLKADMGRVAPVAHQLYSDMEHATRSGSEGDPQPDRIGKYAILDTLGTGGMGIVYLAEQEDPQRRVALKVIHAGLRSSGMVRRFKQEAQLLGRLQHPGIAHVYEAGVAPMGHGEVPFFAMEYVDGKPLTNYADACRLNTRQRLDLFVRVCDAVQHAHQKGIIHRDLKPANILVDTAGQPKVLDFGVARVTDADVQLTTLRTNVGQLIGTLPYMSPEQVAGDPSALDTRSDVYALGVVLYELLTDRLPHDLTNKTVLEAARVIREDAPARISSFNKVLRGDIETIIGKAMEKEADRRYASASDLAADIRHYLANEPIAARPASTLYQLSKFARRNRAFVSAVAVIFVALSGALVQMTSARNRALEAERLAAERLVQVGSEANKVAVINQFFNDMLASADPEKQGRDVKVADVLDRYAQDLGERLGEQPDIEASLQHTIGTVYAGLGLFNDAEGFLRSAHDTRTELHGDTYAATLATRMSLAAVLRELNQWTEAEQLIQQTLETRRATLGHRHEDTLSASNALADVLQKQGKVAEAVALWRETLDSQRQVLAPDNRELLATMNNLAQQLKQLGKPEEAEPLLRETLALQIKASGEEHPDTLVSMGNLAVSLKSQGKYDEAEQLLRTVIEVRRRVFGDHPSLFTSVNNYARLLRDQGKLTEAESFAREALEGWRRTLGESNRLTLIGLNNVASLVLDLERPAEAEPLFRELLEIAGRSLPKGHWMTFIFQRNLAKSLVALARFEEAEPLLLESHEELNRRLGPAHQHTKKTLRTVIELYERWDRPKDAALWRQKSAAQDN